MLPHFRPSDTSCEQHASDTSCEQHASDTSCEQHASDASCEQHASDASCKQHASDASCKQHASGVTGAASRVPIDVAQQRRWAPSAALGFVLPKACLLQDALA